MPVGTRTIHTGIKKEPPKKRNNILGGKGREAMGSFDTWRKEDKQGRDTT